MGIPRPAYFQRVVSVPFDEFIKEMKKLEGCVVTEIYVEQSILSTSKPLANYQ
jgi:hypothetical protein